MIFGMPVPLAMIVAGVVFLLAAIKVLIQQRRIVEVVPHSAITIEVPTKWDDNEIKGLLQRYSGQPTVLSHFVSSVRARMIMNQDLKTAQKRLQLITGVIQLFKLNKELQDLLYDLHLAEKEFEIKQIETATRKEDAQGRQESERALRELRRQRDELQLKKEIAQLQSDITTIKTPVSGPQEQRLSAEQQRRLKRMEIEDKLKDLDRLEAEAVKTARSDEDRMRVENMYADKRQELNEQLSKYLV